MLGARGRDALALSQTQQPDRQRQQQQQEARADALLRTFMSSENYERIVGVLRQRYTRQLGPAGVTQRLHDRLQRTALHFMKEVSRVHGGSGAGAAVLTGEVVAQAVANTDEWLRTRPSAAPAPPRPHAAEPQPQQYAAQKAAQPYRTQPHYAPQQPLPQPAYATQQEAAAADWQLQLQPRPQAALMPGGSAMEARLAAAHKERGAEDAPPPPPALDFRAPLDAAEDPLVLLQREQARREEEGRMMAARPLSPVPEAAADDDGDEPPPPQRPLALVHLDTGARRWWEGPLLSRYACAVVPPSPLPSPCRLLQVVAPEEHASDATTALSLPFVRVAVGGAAHRLQVARSWQGNGIGHVLLEPVGPAPLQGAAAGAELQVRLTRPHGAPLSDVPDCVELVRVAFADAGGGDDPAAVLASPAGSVVSLSSCGAPLPSAFQDVPGVPRAFVLLQVAQWFSRFAFAENERLVVRGYRCPAAGAAAAAFEAWLNAPEGHRVAGIAHWSAGAPRLVDGHNDVGYAQLLVVRAPFEDPARGTIARAPLGGSADAEQALAEALRAAASGASGRALNASRQVHLTLAAGSV
jgi:GNAT superfamily N-acetyltransferase